MCIRDRPPVIRALTSKKERMIRMDYNEERASKLALILFPIIVTAVAGIIVPMCAPLVGSLMSVSYTHLPGRGVLRVSGGRGRPADGERVRAGELP